MTLHVPLAVRLVTTKADRHVTADLRDLSFRSVVPGGFASARMSLNRPLRLDVDEIAYYAPLTIYDKRNGNTVWAGRLEDLGRGAGSAGEIREIAAVGGSAHAQDRSLPHIFVDTGTEDWEPATNSAKYVQISEILSNDVPAIMFQVPQGTLWSQTHYGEVWYRRLVDTMQRIARLNYSWDAGFSSVNNEINMVISAGTGGTEDEVDAAVVDTAGGTLTAVITTDWSAGVDNDVARCWSLRIGPNVTTVDPNSNVWFIPCVRSVLWDVNGNERTAAANYTSNFVRAHEIVNDLLGRILSGFDGPNASVATNTYDIDQLAYREPVTAATILGDLMGFHPDHYWAAWERTSSGLYRFVWRAWPTTIRYEADVVDGFDAPGSAVDLYNAVSIRWVGAQGRVRHSRRTSTVALLDDAGLTRESYIDLKFDAGSSANAIQAGDQFLEDHAVVTNAGRLTIARPILDRDTGRMIMPWEIRPGELIRVRGVQPSRDALNTTTRNSVTVFKVVAVDFDASSAAATLELDSEPVSLAHQLARSQPPPTIARKKR